MAQTKYSKSFDQISTPDIAISMGCDVGCPYIGRTFDDNWGLPDPTGKIDEDYIKVIKQIEINVQRL
ncbi:MAG: ArsC family transcriptional regulator [Acutalibacteraceae bacterium]